MPDAYREPFPVLPGLSILDRLGGGAVGTVYLARHEALGRLVAVKVLRRELANNRLYLERLRREARLSTRLDHPNVVKGLDLGEVDGVPFFVMEFIDGKSLKTVLRERGRLDHDEVLEYGIQIARALDHAYRHGVVHRDIKPENLIIARDGTIKLTDLGLARRPDDSSVTKDGVMLGTPHYFSPEQARDPASADVRSDLYSLGATLFHAATGRPPFDAETVAELLVKVNDLALTPELPPDVKINKNLELVIRRLLAKDPARRYPTPDDLMRDLERVKRRERPNVRIFDINPNAQKRMRLAIVSVLSAAMLGVLLYGVAKWAGAVPDAGPGEAALSLAAKLNNLQKEIDPSPAALAGRWKRLEDMLSTGAFADLDRVRAVELQSSIENQLFTFVTGLERASEQDLAKATNDHRFADAAQLLENVIPERFREPFLGGVEPPKKVSDRIREFLIKKTSEVERETTAAEVKLTEALPRFLALRESSATELLEKGNYKSALAVTTDPLLAFQTDDGIAWSRMPAAARERLAPLAIQRMNELRSRILESARDTTNRFQDRIRREHQRLEEALRGGLRTAVAADFEDIAKKALEDAHYIKEEWPPQVSPDPERIIKDYSSSLHLLERQRERDVADRAFAEHDMQLTALARERKYITVLDGWRARVARATVAPVIEKMERRMRYAELLVALRERFVKNVDARKGKKLQITLRSGAAVSGKVLTILPGEDDVIVKLMEGSAPEVKFSVIATEDIVNIVEFTNTPEDRFLRGVFRLLEGETDQAQAEFASIRGTNGQENAQIVMDAEFALVDTDAIRAIAPGATNDRERRFEDAKKTAKSYESIGEWLLAREWYDRARQEAQGFEAGDPRIDEIKRLMVEFEDRERAQKNANNNSALFPGARVTELPDGRLRLKYDLASIAPQKPHAAWPDWVRTDRGITYDPQSQQLDLAKSPPAKLMIPGSVKGAWRAIINIKIPYNGQEATAAPRRSFQVFGRTLIFAGARSRGPSLSLLRSGGVENIEIDIQQLIAAPEPAAGLGLVRGCVHEIMMNVDADQRTTTIFLDQQFVTKAELGSASGDFIEVRSNAPLEWREVTIEGVVPPKK